jgi:hypothetical protein
LVPTDHDGAVDVDGGRGEIAIGPFPHPIGGFSALVHVHFYVIDAVFSQPDAGLPARGTPASAVHYYTAGWQVFLQGRRRLGRGADAFQFGEEDFVVGLVVDIVYVDVLDDPFGIDDEYGTLRLPIVTQDVVFLGNGPVGPEVAQQRKGDPFKAVCPSFQTRDVVDADAQNLDI